MMEEELVVMDAILGANWKVNQELTLIGKRHTLYNMKPIQAQERSILLTQIVNLLICP